DRLCQYRAALECRDVRREPFAKTDDDTTLLRYVLRAESRATTVRPFGPAQWFEPDFGAGMGDALQIVAQLSLLRGELCVRCHVLQSASTTDTEVRALRRNAVSSRNEHIDQLRVVVLTMPLRADEGDRFARKRAGHERGFAFANDAGALVIEGDDRARLDFRRGTSLRGLLLPQERFSHARRNSLRCGSSEVRDRKSTRLNSSH